MAALDYAAVNQYWNQAQPSILGPYMMDGFGFPAAAGRFRFGAETSIVRRLIQKVNHNGAVLDLGSGIGCWTEYFARCFAKVVAVEASEPLYEALRQRCEAYPNVSTVRGDVMRFEPSDRYALVFLGGMLMYLNETDVVSLLRNLIPHLEPGGIILCRETTVRVGVAIRQGDYQAVYRSVSTYERIFRDGGLSIVRAELNVPYVHMQMGCEFVRKWKALLPKRLQLIPIVGRLAYWGLRLGYPWISRVPGALGVAYPELSNHFFVLEAPSLGSPNNRADIVAP